MARSAHYIDTRMRCGEQRHRGGSRQTLETPQYALVYFLGGHGSYHQGQEQQRFGPGSVVQRFPGRRHQLYFDSDAHSVFAALPAPAFRLIRQYELSTLERAVFHPGIDEMLINRFRQLALEIRRRSPLQHARIAAQILELFVDLHQRALALADEETQQAFIEKACQLLQSDHEQALTLEAIAVECGLGYASFRKRFKQLMGLSPGQFRIQQRIEEARRLLSQGYSINTTAEQLGYPDCYSFSKQFKKITGYPPRRFKQLQGLM